MRHLLTALIIAALACPALAQDDPNGEATPPQTEQKQDDASAPDLDQPLPDDVLTAGRAMMKAGIVGMASRAGRRYDLTPAQSQQLGQILTNFANAIPQADQDAIVRGFYYGRQLVQSKQGKPEDFQRIAGDVLPAAERLIAQFDQAGKQFEQLLTDEQREKYLNDQAEFRRGQEEFVKRARQVASGELKLQPDGQPEGGWKALRERDGRVREVEEQVVEEDRTVTVKRLSSKLPNRATVAADERLWRDYVKAFIIKYQLDDGQQKQARRHLGDATGTARAHRKANEAKFDAVARQRAQAETDGNVLLLEQVSAREAALWAPIFAAFEQLEANLEKLPTDTQRESAAHRGEIFNEQVKPDEPKD